MAGYTRFDQQDKLGSPPWSGPVLEAWEAAHGHDARLKCYPEFGCQVIESALEAVEAENERLRAALQRIADQDTSFKQGWTHWRTIASEALAADESERDHA